MPVRMTTPIWSGTLLEPFGIDGTTQDIYLAMIESPQAGVRALARMLGITEDTVRSALDELAEIGLAIRETPASDLWKAIDPEISLPALLSKQQAELAAQRDRIERGRVGVAQVLALYGGLNSGAETSEIERVVGLDAIRSKLTELSERCEREVWSLNPGGGHSVAALRASRGLTVKSLENGIQVRSVYTDSVRNDPETLEHLTGLAELGAETRTCPAIPIRMVLVDRRVAVVPVDGERSGSSALVISGTGLLEALLALYQGIWEQAQPLSKNRPRRSGALNAQEQWALRLWAKGYTDAQVSRRLGVSERTVRRISETVAMKLNSTSRFQSGVLAVAEGWITADDAV